MCDEVGREGVYAGSYEDCQTHITEKSKNNYYFKKAKL